nr:abl interactor 1 isoform X2 [Vanessa tameamea]
MKGPARPAPAVPNIAVNRYSPVTNWNDHPFGADVFEPVPCTQKKKPPPRPPPPSVLKQPDVSAKPTHFIRRPTVLSTLLSRKGKNTVNNSSANNQHNSFTNFNSEVDTTKMFPKCDKANVQTGTLIDLSSPPSSPTFTTRSSSDGVSVDSFGSDATTSTNHHNALSGGNASQAESGFEDDFDLFLHSRKPLNKEDTLDDFSTLDPFSAPIVNKPPQVNKSLFYSDSFDTLSNASSQYSVSQLKGPTIIRAKPARPKPPDNSALLKSTFGSSLQMTSMNINTTTPIQKISNGFVGNVDTKQLNWDHEESPEREPTPPMPTIPPPPPPPIIEDDLPVVWPEDIQVLDSPEVSDEEEEPYAIALFDYFTDHQEDLCFSANSKITLIRRVNDEWLYGRLRGGSEGLFPSNYVEIKVPLSNDMPSNIGEAIALHDFDPVQSGDLRFNVGDKITILSKISEEWFFGDCNGIQGQFPANYVLILTQSNVLYNPCLLND